MQSRLKYISNPQEFVTDFLASIMPGVIPRANFIDWASIDDKTEGLRASLEFYTVIAAKKLNEETFLVELRDAILAHDNPTPLVKCAFELLGHTNDDFVSRQDDLNVEILGAEIQQGSQEKAEYFAKLLNDLGFRKILAREDLQDLLLGVQVGLETNRRKNIGGEQFRLVVLPILKRIAEPLGLTVQEEQVMYYGDALNKKVDFTLTRDDKHIIGIEINFYTVSGSKPTEIKRSYGQILKGMEEHKTELVWITDGKGYRSMVRSLRDAVVIFPNIYNIKQLETHFAEDLKQKLKELGQ